jgi:hypothetical protein
MLRILNGTITHHIQQGWLQWLEFVLAFDRQAERLMMRDELSQQAMLASESMCDAESKWNNQLQRMAIHMLGLMASRLHDDAVGAAWQKWYVYTHETRNDERHELVQAQLLAARANVLRRMLSIMSKIAVRRWFGRWRDGTLHHLAHGRKMAVSSCSAHIA